MRRIVIGVVAGLMVGATGVGAQEGERRHHVPTPRQAAQALVRDYLVPLAASDTRRIQVSGSRCRDIGSWYGCWVKVRGETTCRALVRVRPPRSAEYVGWIPRMRCR